MMTLPDVPPYPAARKKGKFRDFTDSLSAY